MQVDLGERSHADPRKYSKLLPVAAALAAVLFWGGSFSAMRVAVGVLNPLTVMWLRMAIAFVIILPFVGKFDFSVYRKGDWKLLLPMVLLQPCLYFLLEAYALRFTTSSQAGVIASSVPLLVAIGAWLFLSESINRATLAALVMSIAGVVALTLMEGAGHPASNPILGNFLELMAMTSAAVQMIIIKQLSRRYNPWLLTAMQTAAGALFFLPGLVILLQSDRSVFDTRLILCILYLGSFVTLGAFGLYNWALSRLPASVASIFINLVPVIAVILGWSLLDEALSLKQCMAALVVIGGVWMGQRAGRA
jgi:drug/metabolite transporter (DMT)-like permease